MLSHICIYKYIHINGGGEKEKKEEGRKDLKI